MEEPSSVCSVPRSTLLQASEKICSSNYCNHTGLLKCINNGIQIHHFTKTGRGPRKSRSLQGSASPSWKTDIHTAFEKIRRPLCNLYVQYVLMCLSLVISLSQKIHHRLIYYFSNIQFNITPPPTPRSHKSSFPITPSSYNSLYYAPFLISYQLPHRIAFISLASYTYVVFTFHMVPFYCPFVYV